MGRPPAHPESTGPAAKELLRRCADENGGGPRLLRLAAGIVATGYQSGFLQAHQPVGQNVRGYPLLRPGQQLAEVTAVAEHQVVDEDQVIGQPERWAFMRTSKPIAKQDQSSYLTTACIAQSESHAVR